jgi:uncharacterized protein YbjT (DUF2867 family)
VSILVTGGTGRIGSALVPELRRRGHIVVVGTRRAGNDPAASRRLDLATGDGLDAALEGVRTVVLLHSDPRHARQVDDEGTARLARAAGRAGVEHLLLLSIVGCDQIPLRLYRAKVAGEQAVQASGTGWTVQRATQFHTLIASIAAKLRRGPIAIAPRGFVSQPVAEEIVVARLADLVSAGPGGRVADIAGPQRVSFWEAVRLVAEPDRPRVVRVTVPGRVAKAYARGRNLPAKGALLAGASFSEWLQQQREDAR